MTSRTLLRLDADAAVVPGARIAPASVLLDTELGTIVAADTPEMVGANESAAVERVRGTLVPGFVELQVNGAAGHDFRTPDSAGASRALIALLATGVTTCCPTMPTQPADRYLPAIASVAEAAASAEHGPRVAGIHLEGPFLSESRRGAHRPHWLQAPSSDLVDLVLAEAAAPIAIWTLAPELPGALDVVKRLASASVVASAGHTEAEAADLDAAADAGLSMVTHLANAMPPFHHRRPGPVGWALLHASVRVGLILDGHHVHPDVVSLFRSLLGSRAFGVTDAVSPLGLPPGVHETDGEWLDTTTGVARLGGPDGGIAGATVGMDRMVAALTARPDDLIDLVRLCCSSPADAINRPDLGRLKGGAVADLLALDSSGRIIKTWLGGVGVASDRKGS